MRSLRYWLIRKLAGKDMIILNAQMPTITMPTSFISLSDTRGYVANSTFLATATKGGN